jgi:GntR family transcriptional regulator/MocR family aminotransferase
MTLLGGVLSRQGRTRIGVVDHGALRDQAARRQERLEPVPIPVDDEESMRRPRARVARRRPRDPAHQFPTGVVMAPERRGQILAWAGGAPTDRDRGRLRRRVPLRPPSGRRPPGPDAEHVVYCGSASKTLAPTLRLGWVVAPGRLVQELVDHVLYTAIAPPRLEQLAFADFLLRGELDRQLRRMRLRYRRRRDELVRSLGRELPDLRVRGLRRASTSRRCPRRPRRAARRRGARWRGVGLSGMSEHCERAVREPRSCSGTRSRPSRG